MIAGEGLINDHDQTFVKLNWFRWAFIFYLFINFTSSVTTLKLSLSHIATNMQIKQIIIKYAERVGIKDVERDWER